MSVTIKNPIPKSGPAFTDGEISDILHSMPEDSRALAIRLIGGIFHMCHEMVELELFRAKEEAEWAASLHNIEGTFWGR
jgi:hypothetical protein